MTDVILPSSDEVRSPDRLPDCPYKGLQSYTEQDGEYFFGRDADRDLVIANLMASRLTLLYGPSGVGKSSLLQAGVVRHLHRLAEGAFSYLAVGRAVVVYFSAWRDDPLDDLGAALRAAAQRSSANGRLWPQQPLSIELIREVSDRLDADVVLLLDQAEDFMTYHAGPSGEAFAAMLGRIVATPGLRTSVVIGIREDALAKLDRLEAHVPGLFGNTLRLDHLDAAEARQAIEQPLARYSRSALPGHEVTIEPALVDDLLQELRTGRVSVTDAGRGAVDGTAATIETPFLQLVMTRLWAAEIEHGSRVLRRSTLAELGGAERIVRTHLDSVMTELTERQQELAASVFRHLVTPSGMKIAHTAEDLADYAGVPDTAVLTDVLERLAAGSERVLRPVPPPMDQPGPPRYEIFHDVMAPAVLDWRRRYVSERQREQAERALVEARHRAEEQHRRTRRRLLFSRLISGILAVLLIAAVAAGVYAKRSSDEAQHRAQLAIYEQQLQRDPAASLHAALRAWNERHSDAAETAVRTAFDADSTRSVLRGHRGPVVSSVFAPDGRTALTAGDDGTARLFDAGSGRQIHELAAPPSSGSSPLTGASFSPDGAWVVTTAVNGRVSLYETSSGRFLAGLGDYSQNAYARWGILNGRPVLLTWSWDGKPAVLWDATTRSAIARYGTGSDQVWEAALSRDARYVATVGASGLTVWDGRSGRSLSRSGSVAYTTVPEFVAGSDRIAFLGKRYSAGFWYVMFWDWRKGAKSIHETDTWIRQPRNLAVSANGRMVAVAVDKRAVVFDTGTSKVVGQTAEEPDWVNQVDFSSDDRWLVTAGNDGRTRVWIANRWANRPTADLLGHRGGIETARFDPRDPSRLITASYDGTARVWQLPARTVLPGTYGWVLDAGYSADGRYIVTGEESGNLGIYDAQGKLVQHQDTFSENDTLNCARFTPDGDKVVITTNGSYAPRVMNWRTGKEPVTLAASDQTLLTVAVSPDGKTVAAGDRTNRVIVWDLSTGKIVRRLTAGSPDYAIVRTAYLPNSTMIAAASSDGTVRLFGSGDAPSRTIGRPGLSSLRAMTISRDGQLLVTASVDHMLHLWRLSDGSEVRQIDGPNSTISSVALNDDASMLAAAAAEGGGPVWGAPPGPELTTLYRHGDAVNAVEFTPDGRGFLTASDDSTAAVFPCTTCGHFDDLRRNAQERDDNRSGS
jgi:WD40 repeat protein